MFNPLRSHRIKQYLKSIIDMEQRQVSENTSDMDQDEAFGRIFEASRAYTMTSKERLYGLFQAVHYISKRGIQGDFVECGVWRGGSSILAALTFKLLNDKRLFHLFDTYEGMPPPTDVDVDFRGVAAAAQLIGSQKGEITYDVSCRATLEDVEANVRRSGCDIGCFDFVRGPVEQTVKADLCYPIAILRLDTDWYESTLHELEILYPKLSRGGVLIIDDYGHWQGARRAVDEYFSSHEPIMLTRLDYTGRIGIKT